MFDNHRQHLLENLNLAHAAYYQAETFGGPSHHFILTYFSFVTLTSVGYGDITPGSGTARSLAVVEAMIGQFYIAVLIGELIGKRVSQAMSDQHS